MTKSSSKRKRARARGFRKQSRRELRKQKQSEHHYVTCLLIHGEPPTKGWPLGPAGDPHNTREYGEYRDRVQKWWIDRVKSYPAAKPAAGIRFFRRYMQWYNTQKREQGDDRL